MNFGFTPEEAAFRKEVREFLQQEWREPINLPEGSKDLLEHNRAFEKKLAARNWLAMPWPKEYGGPGRSHTEQLIFKEEVGYARAPGIGGQGVGMIGPCILVHGTEEQKKQHIPPILSADIVWAQGFSEPNSGSDLASLQTRAVEDGDDFVLTGQKIWTSNAHVSDWVHVLARTDPNAPKHRGITYFLMDLKSPGVDIRPLRDADGKHGFNELFMDGVRVPRRNVLGEVNRGWYAATTTLDFERSSIGGVAAAQRNLDELVQFAKESGILSSGIRSAMLRNLLAEAAVEVTIGKMLSYRTTWLQSKGILPNYEASSAKLYATELGQRIATLGAQVIGPYAQLMRGSKWAVLRGRIAGGYVSSIGATIAGGTSEIQRNIIATRGLGLPR